MYVRAYVRSSVGLSSALWKNGESDPAAVRLPFGSIGRTGLGMRRVVGFGDQSTGRGTFGANLGSAIVTNGDFTAYVCDSAATRPSSQITLGRLVVVVLLLLIIIFLPSVSMIPRDFGKVYNLSPVSLLLLLLLLLFKPTGTKPQARKLKLNKRRRFVWCSLCSGRRPHSPFGELWTGVGTGMSFPCCPLSQVRCACYHY